MVDWLEMEARMLSRNATQPDREQGGELPMAQLPRQEAPAPGLDTQNQHHELHIGANCIFFSKAIQRNNFTKCWVSK